MNVPWVITFIVLDFRDYKDDMKAYTKDLHSQIIKALRSNKKRLVLLLDNIDRILDSRSGNTWIQDYLENC
jgi:hypothetical protein